MGGLESFLVLLVRGSRGGVKNWSMFLKNFRIREAMVMSWSIGDDYISISRGQGEE
jgi:hypothetical protein